jgi:hypothetical protein
MSLDITRLQNVRLRGEKTTARCPACAEVSHDNKGEHLVINTNGSLGCVVYPGDSEDAKAHRKCIFALCGEREIKPLIVRSPNVGRLGRPNQSPVSSQPPKTGLLGRLGRLFKTHSEPARADNHQVRRRLDDCKKGVPRVLNHSSTPADRPLTEHEHELLMRWSGIDLILEARNLFNATIVEIGWPDEKLPVPPDNNCDTPFFPGFGLTRGFPQSR